MLPRIPDFIDKDDRDRMVELLGKSVMRLRPLRKIGHLHVICADLVIRIYRPYDDIRDGSVAFDLTDVDGFHRYTVRGSVEYVGLYPFFIENDYWDDKIRIEPSKHYQELRTLMRYTDSPKAYRTVKDDIPTD